MFEIDNQRIADPNLIEEVAQFTNECYAQARVKLFRDKNVTESWTDASGLITKWEAGWIGSKVFMDTGGYYDSMRALSPSVCFLGMRIEMRVWLLAAMVAVTQSAKTGGWTQRMDYALA